MEYVETFHESDIGSRSLRNPEALCNEEQMAWKVGGEHYLILQTCEDGWDYTLYDESFQEIDGGQLDMPELSIEEARKEILEDFQLEKSDLIVMDYEEIVEKAESVETERLEAYEVNRLSSDIDQFLYDFDPYDYNDQCASREEGMNEIRQTLLLGKTDEMKAFLQEQMLGEDVAQAIRASDLCARIEKYEKSQLTELPEQKKSLIQQLNTLKMDTEERPKGAKKAKEEVR